MCYNRVILVVRFRIVSLIAEYPVIVVCDLRSVCSPLPNDQFVKRVFSVSQCSACSRMISRETSTVEDFGCHCKVAVAGRSVFEHLSPLIEVVHRNCLAHLEEHVEDLLAGGWLSA